MKKRCFLSIILIAVLSGLWINAKSVDEKKSCDVKTFTAFFSVNGDARDDDNDIKELIAERIGARCEEYWLSGQSVEDIMNEYIANGEYPDFISGGRELYEADASNKAFDASSRLEYLIYSVPVVTLSPTVKVDVKRNSSFSLRV